MIKNFKQIITSLVLITSITAFGQTKKEQALTKATDAIKLMDAGKYDESRKLLEEAKELDPERIDYPYEIGYSYYLQKNYPESIKELEKIENHKDARPELYQLLGNAYDIIGDPKKAIEKYQAGLKKFPKSGMLYLEIGNVLSDRKSPEDGIKIYELGIEADPSFPSNYYRAAKYYCASTEEAWGMMYGEIFINLERGSNRTAEISKLLFDTYKSQIKFTSPTTSTTSFCQRMSMNINDPNKLPFCLIYEPILIMSLIDVNQIDLNTLDKIRTNFVKNYYHQENTKRQSNVLFEYQKALLDSGNLEAYNHWLLLKGDSENFDSWKQNNETKWSNFLTWFKVNPIVLNDENKFYQGKY